jgi:5-methylcytosine-specific restriction endonuclease McrA
MEKFKRAQDLISQKRRKAASFEETLQELIAEYIGRNDPVEKAKRSMKANSIQSPSNANASVHGHTKQRSHLKAQLKHQIHFRDGGQCTQKNAQGERCYQRRWLDVHHIVPVSQGGSNELHNLRTLCHNHHNQLHLLQ